MPPLKVILTAIVLGVSLGYFWAAVYDSVTEAPHGVYDPP